MSRRFGALFEKWRILRGDKVKIIAGKDKGETGTIARVLRSQNRVIVEGLNLVRAWTRAAPLSRARNADGPLGTLFRSRSTSSAQRSKTAASCPSRRLCTCPTCSCSIRFRGASLCSSVAPIKRLRRLSAQRRRSHCVPLFARRVEGAHPVALRRSLGCAPFLHPLCGTDAPSPAPAAACENAQRCSGTQRWSLRKLATLQRRPAQFSAQGSSPSPATPRRFGSRAASLPRGR